MARRPKNSGSFYEREPGVWRIRVTTGTDAYGKQRQVERVFRGTKTGASKRLKELIGTAPEKTPAPITVSRMLDDWLRHQRRQGLAPSTLESYQTIVTKHLQPYFGTTQLARLDAKAIADYYTLRTEQGLAARTIRTHGAVLSGALSLAVDWDLIQRNPCSRAKLPPKPASTRQAPGPELIHELIASCGEDVDLATAIILGAITGARRGELCGLKWSDVDWEGETLSIERQRIPLKGGDHTTLPKREKVRRVALGPGGLAVLKRYDTELTERARVLGTQRPSDGWLLSYDCGFTPMRAKGLGQRITDLGKAIGQPVTTHLLRYFAATQMVGAGVDVMTVANRLGHDPQVLLGTYAKFLPQKDREAARQLEAGLNLT